MGVGKSPLVDMLADAFDASPNVIHVDEFAYRDKSNRPYAEAIDVSALNTRLASLLQKPTWTILEAVCLGEVVPEAAFGRGFVIYVKRVAVVGPDVHPWHGFDEGAALPKSPLFQSIHCYHVQFRPHEKAGILLVHPEELHSFSDRAPRA
jgi:hypothetical protein